MSALATDDRGVLVVCASCGRTNRSRYESLGRAIRCAHCHTTLSRIGVPVDAARVSVFDTLLSRSAVPVMVDFWAPWCGPCRMMAPELEKVAAMMTGDVLVVKVNTEDVPELAERYGIRSIPTVAVFHDGQEVARRSGALPAQALRDLVAGAITSGRRG